MLMKIALSNEYQENYFFHAMQLIIDCNYDYDEICKNVNRNGIINIMRIFVLIKLEIKELEYKRNPEMFQKKGQNL